MLSPLHQVKDTSSTVGSLATFEKANLVRFDMGGEYVLDSFGNDFGVDFNIGIEEGDWTIIRGRGGKLPRLGYGDDQSGERLIGEVALLGG